MTDQLNKYFENYADSSIQRMKKALIAIRYYERIKLRLQKKEDLSHELAVIGKVGPVGTMQVVKEAIADHKKELAGAKIGVDAAKHKNDADYRERQRKDVDQEKFVKTALSMQQSKKDNKPKGE